MPLRFKIWIGQKFKVRMEVRFSKGESAASIMYFSIFLRLLVLCSSLLSVSAVSNSAISLTLPYQNNLNASGDVNHIGFLLLDKYEQKQASAACATFNETPLSYAIIQTNRTDFILSLSYVAYAGRAAPVQLYYIDNGVVGCWRRC